MMTSVDFEEDAAPVVTNEDLKEITALGKEMLQIELRIKYHEEIIAALKEDYVRVSTNELPEAMRRCGMEKFTLTNGAEITVKKDVAVNIAKKNEPAAYEWLKENGHGSLVKTREEIFFGKHEAALRKQFEKMIGKTKFKDMFSVSEGVNKNSLKAFVRHELEEQGDMDETARKLLGVWEYSVAKITLPKDARLRAEDLI